MSDVDAPTLGVDLKPLCLYEHSEALGAGFVEPPPEVVRANAAFLAGAAALLRAVELHDLNLGLPRCIETLVTDSSSQPRPTRSRSSMNVSADRRIRVQAASCSLFVTIRTLRRTASRGSQTSAIA
jgi:hypothetical protein